MFSSFSIFNLSSDGQRANRYPRVWLLIALFVCLWQSGCVRRRMTIRSDPPGAVVYVDDYEIGTTPVSHDFTYYGTRKIRLVMDGYETLTVMQPVPPPWYQIPPLDFVAENVVPGKIRDQRVYHYRLTPQMVVPTGELLGRAEDLRRGGGQMGAMVPLTPSPVIPEPVPAPEGMGSQPVFPMPPRSP